MKSDFFRYTSRKKRSPLRGNVQICLRFLPEQKRAKPTIFYGKEAETQEYYTQPRYGSSVKATDRPS